MLTSDFDYDLPKQLIAQIPLEKRDSSRLMVVDRQTKKTEDKHFSDIIDYLQKGDLLVWNNSKVFKARLRGTLVLDEEVFKTSPSPLLEKRGISLTDRILNVPVVEIFLIKPMENNKVWKVLAKPGKKLRLGMKVVFAEDFSAEVVLKEDDGTYLLEFAEDDMSVRAKANKYGEVPTPPYVVNPKLLSLAKERLGEVSAELSERYQTVYAKEEGSVAAPTAGFHFTPELIEKLKTKGVEFAEITLHVGLGTFLPVKTERLEEHKIHSEWVELTSKNADLINQAKAEGRRVVAVGTTTVRTLEGIVLHFLEQNEKQPALHPYTGEISIFIFPSFKFKIVDALITNFHLPKSTLLALVAAFAGDKDFMLKCYQKAVEEKYRFFSFGDAMFIK